MGSRYYSLPLLKWEAKDGKEVGDGKKVGGGKKVGDGKKVGYVSRRFLPSGDEFDLLLEHRVAEGERLDTITAQYLDDPEQFWRICDANETMSPFELTDPVGRKIRITLPQGIQRPRNA